MPSITLDQYSTAIQLVYLSVLYPDSYSTLKDILPIEQTDGLDKNIGEIDKGLLSLRTNHPEEEKLLSILFESIEKTGQLKNTTIDQLKELIANEEAKKILDTLQESALNIQSYAHSAMKLQSLIDKLNDWKTQWKETIDLSTMTGHTYDAFKITWKNNLVKLGQLDNTMQKSITAIKTILNDRKTLFDEIKFDEILKAESVQGELKEDLVDLSQSKQSATLTSLEKFSKLKHLIQAQETKVTKDISRLEKEREIMELRADELQSDLKYPFTYSQEDPRNELNKCEDDLSKLYSDLEKLQLKYSSLKNSRQILEKNEKNTAARAIQKTWTKYDESKYEDAVSEEQDTSSTSGSSIWQDSKTTREKGPTSPDAGG